MKFCWTTLRVRNMEESLKFYQNIVGLEVNRRFKTGPEVEIAFLGDGETKIELICNAARKEANFGQDISLGFETDSADKMMEYVKENGAAIYSGPFHPNPHIKFFYVLDPDGLKIQFVENL